MENAEIDELKNRIKNMSDIELAMEYSDLVVECSSLRDEELELRCDSFPDAWDDDECDRNEELVFDISERFEKMQIFRDEITDRFVDTH